MFESSFVFYSTGVWGVKLGVFQGQQPSDQVLCKAVRESGGSDVEIQSNQVQRS